MSTTQIAPDVGAIFEYGRNGMNTGPGSYRVTGWLRQRVQRADALDMALSGALPDEYGGRAALVVAGFAREISGDKLPSMENCLRQCATHVAGYGVAGCIAPVGEIIVTGKVDWPGSVIAQARDRAVHLAHDAAARSR